ncbi:coagulation factor VII-like [Brienomyrus brachyistius]|uniref:coagulation factor VII-like n=1 Tax=Brienomyrus brachyistius TaxID=42636 RepID=UPI0020B18C3E|nr:coagulation factor VII-like [Brienomyrus brachyistius]
MCACADDYALAEDGRSCIAQALGWPGLQVLLQHKGYSYCGGVIVHPSWVVTTAHCLINLNVENLMVVAGEHNLRLAEGTEQKTGVAEAVLHRLYNVTTSDSNIALLRLHQPIMFSDCGVPVCLPRREFAENELAAMRYSTVSGWVCRIKAGYTRGDIVTLYPPTLLEKYVLFLLSFC